MVSVSQEFNMMLKPGQRHVSLKSMNIFLKRVSGFGETQHTHFRHGAKLLTRSMCLDSWGNMSLTVQRPEKDTWDDTLYNYHVSKVHIWSEHCMGFIKGWWSSLRGLHIQINEIAHIHFASLWITSCIILHTFTIWHEAGPEMSNDEFYSEGIQIMEEEKKLEVTRKAAAEARAATDEGQWEAARDIDLLEGKLMREYLKKELFAALY